MNWVVGRLCVMVRYIIWSQVVLALVALVATLADQGRVPSYLFPPQAVLAVCVLSVFILPIVVIVASWCRKSGWWQIVEVITSVVLALVTMLALLPLVA